MSAAHPTRRRWVVGLPVLVALLFTLGPSILRGGAAEPAEPGRIGASPTAVVASTNPAAIGLRPDARVLAKRGGGWTGCWPAAVGRGGYLPAVPAYRPPVGLGSDRPGPTGRDTAHGERGPPARV